MTGASRLIFRADCGAKEGLGHVMRCSAIAAAARAQGWQVTLLTNAPDLTVLANWRALGATILPAGSSDGGADDASGLLDSARAAGADAVVVDRYGLIEAYWDTLRSFHGTLVAIDDLATANLPVDLVVNPNPGADVRFARAYALAGRHLLGSRFALVRPEITSLRPVGGGGILITLGGGESARAGRAIAEMLIEQQQDANVVLVGSADTMAPHARLQHYVRCDLAPLLASADLVICGGGVTAIEAAALRRPTILFVLADNQAPGAQTFHERGAAFMVKDFEDIPAAVKSFREHPERVSQMTEAAVRLIDGKGGARVMSEIENAMLARAAL